MSKKVLAKIHYKFIVLAVFIILLFVGLYLGIKYQEKNHPVTKSSQYQAQFTKDQATKIVKNLPEVRNFLKLLDSKKKKWFINAEDRKNGYWYVQVAEVVDDGMVNNERMSHTATFNWYKIDKKSAKVICSFDPYDKNGKPLNNGKIGSCI